MKTQMKMYEMNDKAQMEAEVNKLFSEGWVLDEYYPKMMDGLIMFKFNMVN